MKALLLLSILLSGTLAITAAAVEEPEAVKVVEAPEAVKVVEAPEAGEAAPQELQENNQNEDPEVVSTGHVASPEGRFSSCPPGWTKHGNACYQFISSGRFWSSAAPYCHSLGASLASVHNVFEYSFLQDLTRRAGHTGAWLGGLYFQNHWMWVDQSSFNYNNWGPYHPPSSNPCTYLSTTVGWSNYGCDFSRPFICVRRFNSC